MKQSKHHPSTNDIRTLSTVDAAAGCRPIRSVSLGIGMSVGPALICWGIVGRTTVGLRVGSKVGFGVGGGVDTTSAEGGDGGSTTLIGAIVGRGVGSGTTTTCLVGDGVEGVANSGTCNTLNNMS